MCNVKMSIGMAMSLTLLTGVKLVFLLSKKLFSHDSSHCISVECKSGCFPPFRTCALSYSCHHPSSIFLNTLHAWGHSHQHLNHASSHHSKGILLWVKMHSLLSGFSIKSIVSCFSLISVRFYFLILIASLVL